MPDGCLASGCRDNTVRLWNIATATEIKRFEGYSRWINVLCPLRRGQVALAGKDKTIRLLNVTTGAEIARLNGHTGEVYALCLLANGWLISGSHDRTIRVWDTTAICEITRLEVDAEVLCLATLPDGRFVAGDALGRFHWLKIVT
jgi:WD40 repeat protein